MELAFGDSASLRGIRGAVKRDDEMSASAEASKKNANQHTQTSPCKINPR
jgi:hypothetical protein